MAIVIIAILTLIYIIFMYSKGKIEVLIKIMRWFGKKLSFSMDLKLVWKI